MSLKPSICRKITVSIPECTETCDERLDELEQVVSEMEEDINVILVDEFPTEPQENIIYLVKNENGGYTFYQYDGTWRVIDAEFSNITSNGEALEPLQPATAERLGGVIIGDGLVWNGDGRISVAASPEGGIPEAPIDGGSYVRHNGQWTKTFGFAVDSLWFNTDPRLHATSEPYIDMPTQTLVNAPGYLYIRAVFRIDASNPDAQTIVEVHRGHTAWANETWDSRRVRSIEYKNNGDIIISNGRLGRYDQPGQIAATDNTVMIPLEIYGIRTL